MLTGALTVLVSSWHGGTSFKSNRGSILAAEDELSLAGMSGGLRCDDSTALEWRRSEFRRPRRRLLCTQQGQVISK